MLSELPFRLSGNALSKYLLIFLHGWPDTFELWDPILSNLSKDFHCINISYPNFSTMRADSKWGYDFPEISEAIKHTIDKNPQISSKLKIIIAHDWGCFYSYLCDEKHPNYFKSMVSMEISPYFDINFLISLYQLTLASAFLIGGCIGKFLTKGLFLKIIKYNKI